jgi:uncharacterized protein YdeI (YjbR/CyaY-like superfamily)
VVKNIQKASGIQSIDWSEAVKMALCWGWIDGIKKSVDGDYQAAYLKEEISVAL